MDWATAYYVKLYRSQSPDWLALSPLTRGIFDEMLLIADRGGRIPLGKAGLSSVAVPLRGSWAELAPHVEALLSDGCLVLVDGALAVRGFVEAQARAKTPAERKATQRGKTTEKMPRVTPSHAVSRSTVTDRDVSRDVTLSHACHDKEQTEQNRTERTKAEAARGAAPAKLDDPTAQSILDALLACQSLARLAHRGTAEALVAHVNGGAKRLEWVLAAVREFGEQESILAGSPSGPTPDRELAAGLRGFVAKARAATATVSAGAGGYPSRPHLTEAPSVASQMPFRVAPREAS